MNFSELAVIFAVAIAVFNPKRLPEIARAAGIAVRKIQAMGTQFQATMNEQIQLQELQANEERAKKADVAYQASTAAKEGKSLDSSKETH